MIVVASIWCLFAKLTAQSFFDANKRRKREWPSILLTKRDPTKFRNEQSITVNIHDHMMFEFAIRKALGQKDIFNTYYLPQLKRGCFNVVATTIGSNSPCLSNLTDDLVFGAMEQWDMLQEEEKISGAFHICTNVAQKLAQRPLAFR